MDHDILREYISFNENLDINSIKIGIISELDDHYLVRYTIPVAPLYVQYRGTEIKISEYDRLMLIQNCSQIINES